MATFETEQYSSCHRLDCEYQPHTIPLQNDTGTVRWLLVLTLASLLGLLWWRNREERAGVRAIFKKQLAAIPAPNFFWYMWTMLKISARGTFDVDFLPLLTYLAHIFYKDGMYRLWVGFDQMVVVLKTEMMEAILSNLEFSERIELYRRVGTHLIGNGLITSLSTEWKKRRKLLNPAFHSHIIEKYITTMNDQSQVLVQKLKQCSDGEPVDILPYVRSCALDIICETILGADIRSQQNQNVEYSRALHIATKIGAERITQPWLQIDFIFNMLPIGRKFNKNITIVRNFTKKMMLKRKKELLQMSKLISENIPTSEALAQEFGGKRKLAFMDLLLHQHLFEKVLSEEDVQGEVESFMFAGHDSSAVTISWALFLIASHSNVQERIHKELDEIFGEDKERPITSADLKEMTYLKCVLNETLRLHPPGGILGRVITKDLSTENYTIPAGTQCLLFLHQLHRDPNNFPNPETFRPERFLSTEHRPFSYLPFSAGPRNCIGKKFAENEQLIVLADVLRNFTLKTTQEVMNMKTAVELVFRPASPMFLSLTQRKR